MKGYTDLEQSKKLAGILPHESADMLILNNVGRSGDVDGTNCHTILKENLNPLAEVPEILPCWSLASLLDILPEIQGDKPVISLYDNYITYPYMSDLHTKADNLVDACYEMILKLHEKNLL